MVGRAWGGVDVRRLREQAARQSLGCLDNTAVVYGSRYIYILMKINEISPPP